MDYQTFSVDLSPPILDLMIEHSKQSSFPSLHVAVIGLGGIGSAFAFQFARTGHHEVTAVARPGSLRLEQLKRDRGIVKTNGERAEVLVTDALEEKEPYDLVIVTLLAHQVDAVLPSLQRSAAKCVLFMFNTFDPDRLQNAMGSERCAFGMPFIQAFLDANGLLNATLGAGGQKSKIGEQRWVDAFNAAGIAAVLEPRMLLWLRCHAPMCIAFESASVAGVHRGGGASWGESMVLARGAQEGFALIRALGYTIYPAGKNFLAHSPAWVVASILWLLSRIRSFRELVARGAGECRALVDVLVAAAPRANPPIVAARIEAMKPTGKIL
jgi:2-dehydropantoate 2-reductase